MPSSRRRCSALRTRPSRIRSPALSCTTRSAMESHSGVAYSGWLPTSRYRRAPFSRNTLLERPQETTRRKRYRATSSGLRRRWPRRVQVTPYSFSSPKMRRSTRRRLPPRAKWSAAPSRSPRSMVPVNGLTRLTWVQGAFHARVVAARLRAEGIDVRLAGSVDGTYGVTVGDLARVDVYVPDAQLDAASFVLLADEVDATLGAPTEWWDAGEPRRRSRWPWLAAALLLV